MSFESMIALACLHAFQIGMLSVFVLALTRLVARDRPHLAHILWAIVLLKCLTPPVVASPASLFSWVGTWRASLPPAAESPFSSQVHVLVTDSVAQPVGFPAASVAPESAIAPVRVGGDQEESEFSLVRSVAAVFLLVWVGGVVLIGLVLAWRVVAYLRLVRRQTIETPSGICKLKRQLTQQLGVRRQVRLKIVDGPIGPAVFGVFRPTLLLPRCILEESFDSLKPLIAHELVHARRGDLGWSAVQTLALLLWWFHPCVWLAGRMFTRETERSCDEETIASLRCKPADYARSLLSVLEQKKGLVAAPIVPGVRPVDLTVSRMERIMRIGHGSHARGPRWAYALLVIGAVLTLPGAAFLVAQEGNQDSTEWQSLGTPLPRAPGLVEVSPEPAPAAPNTWPAVPPNRTDAGSADMVVLSIKVLDLPTTLLSELARSAFPVARRKAAGRVVLAGAVESDLGVAGRLVIDSAAADINRSSLEQSEASVAFPIVLDDTQLKTIDRWLAARQQADVMLVSRPRVCLLSGKKASMQIGTQRPFLVAVDGPGGNQPSFRVVEEGLRAEFQVTIGGPVGQQLIDVQCELTETSISSIEETTKTTKDGTEYTLQWPATQVWSISCRQNVPIGSTFAVKLGGETEEGDQRSKLFVIQCDRVLPGESIGQAKDSSSSEPAAVDQPTEAIQASGETDAAEDQENESSETGQPRKAMHRIAFEEGDVRETDAGVATALAEFDSQFQAVFSATKSGPPRQKAEKTAAELHELFDRIVIEGPEVSRDEYRAMTRPFAPPGNGQILNALGQSFEAAGTNRKPPAEAEKIVVEAIADYIDPPQIGQGSLHHRHYKCTVYGAVGADVLVDVVYVDHTHLILKD